MHPHFHYAYESFSPFLDEADARRMVGICADFGSYGMYSEEGLNDGIGEGLPQRFDAAFNFVASGGRLGRSREDLHTLATRTNYFRETYAYGEEIHAPGIETFYRNQALIEAARAIFDRAIVEPAIVFANILVPGQELAIHTDVPEFRGLNRKKHPQWLLVVMHHSGLFDDWRIPIATAVSWYHDARGGAFAFYPGGAKAPVRVHEVAFNTAVILDTDSVFHGVDRVDQSERAMPVFEPGMRLYANDRRWTVKQGDQTISEYAWEEMRFSVSWKAYCFADEGERKAWREGSQDLSLDHVLDTLCDDLRARGRIDTTRPANRELAKILVDEYVGFPASVPDHR